MCLFAICMSSLEKVYSRLLSIFQNFFILSCMSCLCILHINHLSVIEFTNIFSHSVGCLLVLRMVYSAPQKLSGLTRLYLFISAFIHFALGDRSKKKKTLLQFMSNRILPMFSSGRFMVSGLTFRSLIHFDCTLAYKVRTKTLFI